MVTEEKSGEHQSQEALLCGNNTSEISSVCPVGLTEHFFNLSQYLLSPWLSNWVQAWILWILFFFKNIQRPLFTVDILTCCCIKSTRFTNSNNSCVWVWQWACMHNTTATQLKQLNETQAMVLLFTPVLFSSVKTAHRLHLYQFCRYVSAQSDAGTGQASLPIQSNPKASFSSSRGQRNLLYLGSRNNANIYAMLEQWPPAYSPIKSKIALEQQKSLSGQPGVEAVIENISNDSWYRSFSSTELQKIYKRE